MSHKTVMNPTLPSFVIMDTNHGVHTSIVDFEQDEEVRHIDGPSTGPNNDTCKDSERRKEWRGIMTEPQVVPNGDANPTAAVIAWRKRRRSARACSDAVQTGGRSQTTYASPTLLIDAWWAVTFPGLAIFVTVLSVSLIGDGLADALNPKLRDR